MRRTITTLNRFTTFITNWWANPRLYSVLVLLVLLSCEEQSGDVGFKNPNRDFGVFVKEFTIPSKVYLMDSLSTSYGYVMSPSAGIKTVKPNRFLCGTVTDDRFGKTTATAYTQYWAASFPLISADAVFEKLTLTLIFDYYWYGSHSGAEQTFEVHEVTDSILTYIPHYIDEPTPYGRLLGTGTHVVNPDDFDENVVDNADDDTNNDIMDSLNVTMDETLGRALLAAAIDTAGINEQDYNLFYKFRRKFKGFAITSPNSDKVVGFNTEHSKTRMVLDYRIDTTKYQLVFLMSAPGQASGAAEYTSYTQIVTDRSGTPLAGLSQKYQEFQPADGMTYVQAGTGVMAKLDFSEVFEHFRNITPKALSVAELRIESDEQKYAPLSFMLRGLRADNRDIRTSTQYLDAALDPFAGIDYTFVSKHLLSTRTDGGYGGPFYKAEVMGDDGALFTLNQVSNSSGTILYSGYLTNFMQQELSLSETDFMRYYALVPLAPDVTRGVNGFYFPVEKIKLKVYYTTPSSKE